MKALSGKRYIGGFTQNVILIGVISFLTDASSEMIVPILPLFPQDERLAFSF